MSEIEMQDRTEDTETESADRTGNQTGFQERSFRKSWLNQIEACFMEEGFRLDHSMKNWSEADQETFEEVLLDPYGWLYQASFLHPVSDQPALNFLFELSQRFMTRLMNQPEIETAGADTKAVFDEGEKEQILEDVPFVLNAEWITVQWIEEFFAHLQEEFHRDAGEYPGTIRQYFASKNPDLHLPDRLCFQLAENKEDEEYPFAFVVTYTKRTPEGKIRHVPLIDSLSEFKDDQNRILSLLSGLNAAAEVCPLVEELMVSGELMHPLRISAKEAWQFLSCADKLREKGIICRVPNWWKKKYSSVSLGLSMGAKKQSLFGLETLIELKPYLKVNGRNLTRAEIKKLLEADEGLLMLKGEWVEVDHKKLKELLEAMDRTQGEMSFAQMLRRQAGIEEDPADGTIVPALNHGAWLSGILKKMQNPKMAAASSIPPTVHAKLRPYQRAGVGWLRTMGSFGFGACLADDMGLGKTLQVLTYLEGLRTENPDLHVLLIVPASLIGNWQAEAEKFVPDMPVHVFHGKPSAALDQDLETELSFLNITTYGMVSRLDHLKEQHWDLLILDEAQAIKNPNTKQTTSLKQISASVRIALTGTPVENDLMNLWSIYDFLNQGMLGSMNQFGRFTKKLEDHHEGYGRLRAMIRPFLLRRMKTDRSIVPDLPDKIEQIDYIELSARQKVLYNRQVDQLEEKLLEKKESGIEHKGLVLAALTHLKQICNHPDQFVGAHEFKPSDSGKYAFLKEIIEPIREKRECVLVFSQYRTMTEELDRYLESLFGRKGLVINGETPVKVRQEYATRFNEQKTYIPYMVLSLKAAGTGLNLTAASHVIHFDRWWNPAVENQATDRAFRIGQKKNVLVHKLVCQGTIEEKIEQLIQSKQQLADELISSGDEGAEKMLVNMSSEELISLMRLEG